MDPGLSLFIHPLGSIAVNTGLTELSLQIHVLLPPPSSAQMDKTIKVSLPPSTVPVRGIMLIITNIGPSPNVICEILHADGTVDTAQATVLNPGGPVTGDPTPAVELTSNTANARGGPPTEFWTDVSLLTLPTYTQDAEAFTFDWFFSGGEAQAPADAIKESALQQMVEVQARIIAVSPPISIED